MYPAGAGGMSGMPREVPRKVAPKLVKRLEASSPRSRLRGERDGMNLPLSVPGRPSNARQQRWHCADGDTEARAGGGVVQKAFSAQVQSFLSSF